MTSAGDALDRNLLRHELFAELGRLLYEETKDDDSFFLRHPELYYAISQTEEADA